MRASAGPSLAGDSPLVALVADHATREGARATADSARALGLDVAVVPLCRCATPPDQPPAGAGPAAGRLLVVPAARLRGLDEGATGPARSRSDDRPPLERAAVLLERPDLGRWALPRLVAALTTAGCATAARPLLALAAGVQLQRLPHDLLRDAAVDGAAVGSDTVLLLDPRHPDADGLLRRWLALTADRRTVRFAAHRLAAALPHPHPAVREDESPDPGGPWLDLSRTSRATPWLWDARAQPPRILLSRRPDLARAVRAALLARPELGPDDDHPADHSLLAPGLPVDAVVRRALQDADDEGVGLPAAEAAEWLAAPDGLGRPRLLAALWGAREDLRSAFPEVGDGDASRIVAWARRHGAEDGSTQPDLLARAVRRYDERHPATPPTPRARVRSAAGRLVRAGRRLAAPRRGVAAPTPPRVPGVDLVGYLRGELGIGESARLVRDALVSAGEPVATRAVSLQLVSRERDGADDDTGVRHDTTLVAVNAAQTAAVAGRHGAEWAGSRRIGYWYWEVEDFPPSEHGGFEHVDEVWVATDFVRRAVAPHSPVPVTTLPPPLHREPSGTDPAAARALLGLPPDRPVVLFVFDHLSGGERKNPWGAVEAFRRALVHAPAGPRPLLVLKSLNAERALRDAERLRLLVADDPDVVHLERFLEADQVAALMAACDAYLSLHRAEGLGLTVAEAMAHGKPVVVTAYGGTESFVDDGVARRVPWSYTSIPPGCPPYPAGGRWAEPDLDAAAAALVALWNDPQGARDLGARAAEHLRRHHDAVTAGTAMRERLTRLRG